MSRICTTFTEQIARQPEIHKGWRGGSRQPGGQQGERESGRGDSTPAREERTKERAGKQEQRNRKEKKRCYPGNTVDIIWKRIKRDGNRASGEQREGSDWQAQDSTAAKPAPVQCND